MFQRLGLTIFTTVLEVVVLQKFCVVTSLQCGP